MISSPALQSLLNRGPFLFDEMRRGTSQLSNWICPAADDCLRAVAPRMLLDQGFPGLVVILVAADQTIPCLHIQGKDYSG